MQHAFPVLVWAVRGVEKFVVHYLVESDPQIGLTHKDLREEVPRSRIRYVALVPHLILNDLFLNRHRVTLVIKG